MSDLTHPLTYWPPGDTPTAENYTGRVAIAGKAPREGLAKAGASKAYLREDVFEIGGIVADGTFIDIPPEAREILQVDPRKNRRGTRFLYEATLSDYDGSAMFDSMTVYRLTRRDDGMGGFVKEPGAVGTFPCEITFSLGEAVIADNERIDGQYKVTALKDADLQTGDKVFVVTRNTYLDVTGQVDRPPHGLYLTATLGVSDEQNPNDIIP